MFLGAGVSSFLYFDSASPLEHCFVHLIKRSGKTRSCQFAKSPDMFTPSTGRIHQDLQSCLLLHVATCEMKIWRKTATILCVLHGRKFVSPQNGMHTSSASQILWERCKIDRLAPKDFSLNSSFSDCQHLGLQTKYPNIVQLCTLRFSFKGIL